MAIFRLYGNKHGHADPCEIKKTQTGWYFGPLIPVSSSGECDKRGTPHIGSFLQHEYVHPPFGLEDHLYRLWEKADTEQWNDPTLEIYLPELSNWQQRMAKAYPPEHWSGKSGKMRKQEPVFPFKFSFE